MLVTRSRPSPSLHEKGAPLSRPVVLIVDDNDQFCARVRGLAVTAGFDVHTTRDGHAALELLRACRTSIVVVDAGTAGMGGLELCRRIRAHEWPEYLYVMVLSHRDDESESLAALAAGADDFIDKQISALQFKLRLRTAMRIRAFERSSKRASETARRVQMTDHLTGAFNRRYFKRHLGRELKRIQRSGGNVSLLLLEIDHFKALVAKYGSVAGDAILKEFFRLVAGCFRRDTDWCVRLGRRAFAVVLEGTKVADASAYAQVVRQTIADAVVCTSRGDVRITASIGVSGPQDMPAGQCVTVNDLLGGARTNLYASVLSGCNRVTISDSYEALTG